MHKRGNDPSDSLGDPFRETIEYNDLGRVKGGNRIDGKTFTLDPAQMLGVLDAAKMLLAATAPELVALSRVKGSGTEFFAQANYVDFKDIKWELEMTGFGQYRTVTEIDSEKNRHIKTDQKMEKDGLITTRTDGMKNVVKMEYDPFGNLTKQTDYPEGPGESGHAAVQTYTYDYRFNKVKTHTDAVGRTTTNDYDNFGNLLSITIVDNSPNAPAGSPTTVTQTFTYYSNGLAHTAKDGRNLTTTFEYDTYGRLIKRSYVDGSFATQTYNDLTGNIHRTTDEEGFRAEAEFDAMNRTRETRNYVTRDGAPVVYTSTARFDAQGNKLSLTNRNGAVFLYSYDVWNRQTQEIADAGVLAVTTAWGYKHDAIPTTYTVVSKKEYEYRYQKNGNGHVSVEVFDRHNKLLFRYDQLGRKTTFHYDLADRLYKIEQPAGTITLTLDGRGRTVTQTGPTVEVVDFTYDDADRLIKKVVHNESGFHASGNQITEWTYNLFNLPGKEKDPEGHISLFEYDNAGNVTKLTQGSDGAQPYVITYHYDNRNREDIRKEGGVAEWKSEYYKNGLLKATHRSPRQRSPHGIHL